MNQSMLSGQRNDVLFVDGLKIGITTRSLSATGLLSIILSLLPKLIDIVALSEINVLTYMLRIKTR